MFCSVHRRQGLWDTLAPGYWWERSAAQIRMGINSTHRNATEKSVIYPLIALRGGESEYNNGVLTIKRLVGRKRAFPLLRGFNVLVLGITKCLQVLH